MAIAMLCAGLTSAQATSFFVVVPIGSSTPTHVPSAPKSSFTVKRWGIAVPPWVQIDMSSMSINIAGDEVEISLSSTQLPQQYTELSMDWTTCRAGGDPCFGSNESITVSFRYTIDGKTYQTKTLTYPGMEAQYGSSFSW